MEMLASERKRKIIDYLKIKKRATIEELLPVIEGSISTLRRDLNELEKEKRLRRVHGGAELTQNLSGELSISTSLIQNQRWGYYFSGCGNDDRPSCRINQSVTSLSDCRHEFSNPSYKIN